MTAGRTPRTTATGRPVGRPSKAPELRDPDGGAPNVLPFVAPRLGRRRVGALTSDGASLAAAARAAVKAAPWLLAADQLAVRSLLLVAAALDADQSPASVVRLLPQLAGLMADLGLHAGARARLNIAAAPESTPAGRSRFAPPGT